MSHTRHRFMTSKGPAIGGAFFSSARIMHALVTYD
ncbi:hypothetical protein C8D96_2410 [Kushneria marisflavi]|nr:hypothetical protein C8D96_2410 [Kushneria marisflavi]